MSWIKQIDESEATGKLAELYQQLGGGQHRQVANILKVHSLHPDALEAHLQLYRTIMFGESGLNRAQREMIAVVVSATNACHY
ncbi:MAG: carboxymuconolactone decarboxylase family protein [Peptococcaceae bacterium]|nr:carboxymuconolactone decarboxylase family protein [Peptococcaceae bacterium]